jgi:hypothetical protein
VNAWLVDVTCNAYDARGALVAVSTGNLAELGPGERATTWAIADGGASAVRFACRVGVSDWPDRIEPALAFLAEWRSSSVTPFDPRHAGDSKLFS